MKCFHCDEPIKKGNRAGACPIHDFAGAARHCAICERCYRFLTSEVPPEPIHAMSPLTLKTKYEIERPTGGTWVSCATAQACGLWLHYQLADGTTGIAWPGAWRSKEKKE